MPEPEELSVEAPGGWKGRVVGSDITRILVWLLAVGFIGFVIYQHNAESRQDTEKLQKAQQVIVDKLDKQGEAFDAMIYIMSLSPEERAKLNLSKPRKLYEMQR